MNALTGLAHFPVIDCVPAARFREAGDITLDQFYHDGRVEDRWLDLHAREFAILWSLAANPGRNVSRDQLIVDLSRVRFGCTSASLASHVERLSIKLRSFGLDGLIIADTGEGYSLAASPSAHFLHVPGACLR